MSRVRVALPSLIHGVSQLSAAERQPVHALASDNCWPSVEIGDQKRPPLQHVAKIQASGFGDSYFHGIDRSATERYMVLLKYNAGAACGLVFDTAGTIVPVFHNTGTIIAPNYAGSTYEYLNYAGTLPSQNIRALTVLDYTFVVDRGQICVMDTATLSTAAPTNTAHVFIRQAAFAMKYTVTIQNGTDTVLTINSSTSDSIKSPSTATQHILLDGFPVWDVERNEPFIAVEPTPLTSVRTQDIAENIRQKLLGTATAHAGFPIYGTNVGRVGSFTVTRIGDVLKIIANTGGGLPAACTGVITRFEVTTSQGEQLAFGYRNEAKQILDLPEVFTDGYVMKLTGNALASEDDVYVKFTQETPPTPVGLAKGTWDETIAPGIVYTWDRTRFAHHPHVLVRRTGTGAAPNNVVGVGAKFFTFEPMNLDSRLVGDALSNAIPSFVSTAGAGGSGTASFTINRRIQDCAFFRDRLIFFSDSSISCSEEGSYFNFWRTTVQALPDSDPIDQSLNTDRVIHSGVEFAAKLLLWTARSQHQLTGSPSLTPSTIEASQVSRFESTAVVRPVPYQDGIVFPNHLGGYTTLRNLTPTTQTQDVFDAVNLSIHAPSYIPGNAKQIEATTDSSIIAVLADGDPDAIYILKQHREGETVIQSAWTRFIFDDATIRGFQFFDNRLYVVSERTANAVTELFLEYIDLSPGVSDGGNAYWTMLDRRATPTTLTNVGADTTVKMPYNLETGAVMEIVNMATGTRYIESSRTAVDTFKVLGVNLNGVTCVAGRRYTSTHSFHKPQVMVDGRTGKRMVLDATSAVLALELYYEKTSHFQVNVGSDVKTVGSDGNTAVATTSPTEPTSGVVVIGVGGRLDQGFAVSVTNASPFPHTLVSAEWLLNVTQRSQAVA